MKYLLELARANCVPRLVVASLLGVFIYQGFAESKEEVTSNSQPFLQVAQATLIATAPKEDLSQKLVELAKTDQIALLNWSLSHYQQKIRDYRGTFQKQECINGRLKSIETIGIMFKQQPFSLLMQWQENAAVIDKLLYVEGCNDNQMIVHPTGLLAWIKSVRRDPRGEQARKSSRRTCDQFGFERLMESLLEVYKQAKENGDLKTVFLGEKTINERRCVSVERLLPQGKGYPAARTVLDFDLEYMLPVRVSSYDWQDKLLSQYTYSNLQFNVGLTAELFTPTANGL